MTPPGLPIAGSTACHRRAEPGTGLEFSCAYDGAKVVLGPITDAIHLVHGPINCAGHSWDNRGSLSSGSQLFRSGFTTALSETDIIMGSEPKLAEAIRHLAGRYHPPAIFVYATCVSALAGDDLPRVCAEAQSELGIPVVAVLSQGFSGDKNVGNRAATQALFEEVIGTREPEVTTPTDINLLGEFNVAGELWNIRSLLESVGVRVLATLTGDATFAEVAGAHRANLNVVVCSKAMAALAADMERKYGLPYREESFYGHGNITQAVLNIVGQLDQPGLLARARAELDRRLLAAEREIRPYRERLEGKTAILFTGGSKSWSMLLALQELGLKIVARGVQNPTAADEARLLSPEIDLITDSSPAGLLQTMAQYRPDVVIAGGKTKYLALKAGLPFLDVNHGRPEPLAGFEGMLTIARQLVSTIDHPVWQLLGEEGP